MVQHVPACLTRLLECWVRKYPAAADQGTSATTLGRAIHDVLARIGRVLLLEHTWDQELCYVRHAPQKPCRLYCWPG